MLLPIFIGGVPQEPQIIVKEVVKVKYLKNKSKINKVIVPPKPTTVEPTKILIAKNDAIDCLLNLGLKKSLAKNKVDSLFLKKDYESLEDFIIDAFKIT